MQAAVSQGDAAATDSGRVEVASPNSPRLLDRLREALRSRHYSHRTEETYCHWVKRFIYFHSIRHPAEMAEAQINAFRMHLAVKEKCSQPWTFWGSQPGERALTRRFLC